MILLILLNIFSLLLNAGPAPMRQDVAFVGYFLTGEQADEAAAYIAYRYPDIKTIGGGYHPDVWEIDPAVADAFRNVPTVRIFIVPHRTSMPAYEQSRFDAYLEETTRGLQEFAEDLVVIKSKGTTTYISHH